MEPNETILCGVCGRIVAAVGYICPRCGTNYSPIPVPIQDWPAFWQSLTPAECADALRAAPRVAGEWVEYADGYARDPVIGGDGLPIAEVTFAGEWFVYGDHADNGKGERSKECRDAADAALVAAGWVLL